VLDEPEQILAGTAETVTFGVGSTVMVIVCGALLHPPAEPVTVYVLVLPGDTVIELAVEPVLQL
jgi:hypothetical protein